MKGIGHGIDITQLSPDFEVMFGGKGEPFIGSYKHRLAGFPADLGFSSPDEPE
jgi:hypothetical protein